MSRSGWSVRKTHFSRFAMLALGPVAISSASAETRCVDSLAGLQNALVDWTTSADNEFVIKLVKGTYGPEASQPQALGQFAQTTSASLRMLGGYEQGCAIRDVNAANTVIDGGNEFGKRLLLSKVKADLLVEGITFTRLSDGIEVIHDPNVSATGHKFRVTHCRIMANNTAFGSGQAYTFRLWGFGASNTGAVVALENSLLANNVNHGFGQPSVLSTGSGGSVLLTGSTIASNAIPLGAAGIVLQSVSNIGGVNVIATNSIAWQNGTPGFAYDINVAGAQQPAAVTYTLFGSLNGAIEPTTTNLSSDPRFRSPGAGNFRLNVGSPAFDAGDAGQFELPALDLDGSPRLSGSAVDLGAYEAIPDDLIFFDDME